MVAAPGDFAGVIARKQLDAAILTFASNHPHMMAHNHDAAFAHWGGFAAILRKIAGPIAGDCLVACLFERQVHIAGAPFGRAPARAAVANVFLHDGNKVSCQCRSRCCAQTHNKAEAECCKQPKDLFFHFGPVEGGWCQFCLATSRVLAAPKRRSWKADLACGFMTVSLGSGQRRAGQ